MKRTRHTTSKLVIGVEVEGPSVRSVTLRDGVVRAFRSYSGESTIDALEQWRADAYEPRALVRFVYSGPNRILRATVAAELPEVALPAAIAAEVARQIPFSADETAAAGMRLSPTDDGMAPLSIAVANTADLAPVWIVADELGAGVTAAPLLLRDDGLVLLMQDSGVYVGLVSGGALTHMRQCCQSPREMPVEVFRAKFLSEMQATLSSWGRQTFVPSHAYVYGPAAHLPGLAEMLAKIGVRAQAPPIPDPVAGIELPAAEQAPAALALLAATADLPAYAHFTDPAAEARKAQLRRRLALTRSAAAVAGVVVLAAGAGVFAILSADHTLSQAKAAEATSQARVASVSKWTLLDSQVKAGAAAVSSVTAKRQPFASQIGVVTGTAPAGTTFSSLSVRSATGGTTIQVSATVPGANFAPVATWDQAMKSQGAAVTLQSWSTGQSGGVTVNFTATVGAKGKG